MATIIYRDGLGRPLTNDEVDQNFENLDTDKLEATDLSVTQNSASGTGTLTYTGGVFTYTPPDLSGFLNNEGIEDSVANLLQAGLSIEFTYDDINNELTADVPKIEARCKNTTASTIAVGTPVYQTGSTGGNIDIAPADASDSAKMPAIGVVSADITAGSEGTLVVLGQITGVDTSAFSEGDIMYVASGGGFTSTRPTSSSVLVQNLGRVTKVHASNGGGIVTGAGRSNDIPNLANKYVFIGDGTNAYEKRQLTSDDLSDVASIAMLDEAETFTAKPTFSAGIDVTGNIVVTGTVDGRDVATDGSKLDGIESGATADQTASEILTAVKTVDGAGSGLDADLLDGQHGSYYTSYTDTAIANLVDSAPATLDTLNELAAALGDDANFSTTVTNSIATKVSKSGDTITSGTSIGLTINHDTFGQGLVIHRNDSTNGASIVFKNNALQQGILYGNSSGAINWRPLGTSNNYEIWHEGNDGSGSGLDADLLDGQQGTYYAAASSLANYLPKDITNTNNFNFTGTASNAQGGLYVEGSAGQFALQVYGTGSITGFLDSKWGNWDLKKTHGGNLEADHGGTLYTVWDAYNDGTGSGLDADLLDGQHGSYYQNASNINAGTLDNARLTNLFKAGAEIPSGANLDTYRTTGYYSQNANADAAAGSNYPESKAGILEVVNDDTGNGLHTTQRYSIYNSSNTYTRQYYNGSWGSWAQQWNSVNDGTGSGLDADLLDGQQGSYYAAASSLSSYLPLAGGTLTGDLTVGSTSRTANTYVRALAGDSYTTGFEAYGSAQGTGYTYVGQSNIYGGGMFYNGDGSPAFAAGESADYVSFYRKSNGSNTVVFDYSYNDSIVRFKDAISVAGNISVTGTVDGRDVAADGTKLDGIAAGAQTGTVTSVTGGTYLTGGTITTTGTLAVDATSANTASKVVARDASGNFSAGTITAALSGNATTSSSTTGNAATATTLQTARTINGVSFNGSANITVTANTTNTLTRGSYLTGSNFNGSAATTWAVDATTAATASKVVARDASGYVFAAYYNSAGTFPVTASALTSGMATFTGTNGTDNYGRGYTAAAAAALLSGQTMNINGSSTSTTGNAATATSAGKWTTARTITLGGDLTGNVSIDGSANVTLTATVAANSVALGTDTTGNYVAGLTAGTGITVTGTAGEGWSPTVSLLASDLTLFPTSNFKKSVRAATTANITLSGTQTIDGIALVAGDRVLVKNQTTASQNGIYVVSATAWTRSVAADASAEIDSAVVGVDSGTTNGGLFYTNVFKTTDTVGTTSMPWYKVTTDADLLTSGSTATGAVRYAGTTRTTGQFYGGTTTPNGTTRLNYSGYFYPTFLNLTGSSDTTTAASHYYVETGSDGYVRPKTLANVKTEIVTTAAVNAAAATTVGTVTSGTWNATTISVAKGGTGLTSAGTAGNVLTSDGTNWVSQAPTGGGGTAFSAF